MCQCQCQRRPCAVSSLVHCKMDKEMAQHVNQFFKWLIHKPMCLNIPFLLDLRYKFIKMKPTEKEILDGLPDIDFKKDDKSRDERTDKNMTEDLNKPGPSTDSNTNPMILRPSKISKNVQINKECRVNQHCKGSIKKKKSKKKIMRSASSSTKSDDELTMLTTRYATSTPVKSAGSSNTLRRLVNGGTWHIMPNENKSIDYLKNKTKQTPKENSIHQNLFHYHLNDEMGNLIKIGINKKFFLGLSPEKDQRDKVILTISTE